MSQRGKRGSSNNRPENDGHQPPTKRRKGRPPNSGNKEKDREREKSLEEASAATAQPTPSTSKMSASATITKGGSKAGQWQMKCIADLKLSSIYNQRSSEAPAELFRKDLISAMKLPDSEPLSNDEYWVITDQWRQEWEKGVQVPVNPDSLPEPSVKILEKPIVQPRHDFKLPKTRFLRITKDDSFNHELHYLTNVASVADSACSYDIDQVDQVWLRLLNRERLLAGIDIISSDQFEKVVEELEIRCWDEIQTIMKNEEGLGIEYDENVICDVCRSPESEEANEMVFCDNCNICVHQACYGITAIPSGQWLCRTCTMSKRPDCVLCPNKGGAMKSTKSGKKWAHVSCALWIPEVSIGCVDRMEPITKISNIPQSRWALICVLCRERVGACIQCSVKTCKTAYHVTCAFQHGLEMRAIIEESNDDGVKLRSYCLKHSVGKKSNNMNDKTSSSTKSTTAGTGSGAEDDDHRRKRSRRDMSTEEKNQARAQKLQEVQAQFDKHVNIRDLSCHVLDVDEDAIKSIYNYWILKRKSRSNRPLIPSRREDVDVLATNKQEEEDVEKRKMFVHLRQDLERVRNLCYMVNRREKLSRSYFKTKEQIFLKQVVVLEAIVNTSNTNESSKTAQEDLVTAVMNANRGPAQYDTFYTSDQSEKNFLTYADIDNKILGGQKSASNSKNVGKSSNRGRNKKVNGASVNSAPKKPSVFMDSLSESDSDSESSVGAATTAAIPKKPKTSKESYSRRKKNQKSLETLSTTTSSSSDEEKTTKRPHKNDGLSRIEKEFEREKARKIGNDEISSNDSDDLIQIADNKKNSNRKSMVPIYSDTDSDSNIEDSKKSRHQSQRDGSKMDVDVDSQSQKFRTKAAKKEFVLQQPKKSAKTAPTDGSSGISSLGGGTTSGCETNSTKTSPKTKPKDSKRGSTDISKFATELLVPQRQAAKKASENMRAPSDLPFVPQRQAAKKASENMKAKEVAVPVKEKDKEEEKRTEKEKDDKDKDKLKSLDLSKSKGRGRPSKNGTSSNRTKSKDSEKEFKDSRDPKDKVDKDDGKGRLIEKEKTKNKNNIKRKEKEEEKERKKEEDRRKVEEEIKKEEERKKEEHFKEEEERIKEEKLEELKKKEEDKRKMEEEKRKEELRKEEELERKREEEKERKREEEKERKREEEKERKREEEKKLREEEKERKREEEKELKRQEDKMRKKEEEKQRIKEAEEQELKRNDHIRKKEEDKKSKSSKSSTSIAYVPQRQAAKKAAEHIKSGLVPKPPTAEQLAAEDKEKEKELKTPEKKKAPVRRQSLLKESPNKKVVAPPPPPPARSPTPQKSINLSSSSSESSDSESSTSSSGSGSSSDSDSEEDTNEPSPQKSVKSKEISPKKTVPEAAITVSDKPSNSQNKKIVVDKPSKEVDLKPISQENSSSSTSCSNTNSSSSSPQPKVDEDEEEPLNILNEDSEDPQKLSNEIIEELKMEEEKLLMNYHNPIVNESPQLEDNNTPYTPASCELVINSASPIKSISSSTTTISPPSPSPLPPSSIPPPTPCGAVMNKNCLDIIELDSNSDESVKLVKSSRHVDKNIILPSENSIDFDSKLNSMGDLSSDCIGLGSKDDMAELDKPPPTPMVLEYASSDIKSNQKDATVPSLPQLDQAGLNQSLSTYLWNDFSNAPLFLNENVVTKEDEIKETNKLLEKLRQRRGQKTEDLQPPTTPNSNNPECDLDKKVEIEELLPEKTIPEQNNFFKEKNDFSDVSSAKENINTNVNVTLNSSRKQINDCDYDENTRGIQSPYNMNMWNENDLIPKRRSVSTSPSSVSESNEEFRTQQKKTSNERKEDEQPTAPTHNEDISSQTQANNIFNNFFEGVGAFQTPQQPSIPSPNVAQNILLNGAPNAACDMVNFPVSHFENTAPNSQQFNGPGMGFYQPQYSNQQQQQMFPLPQQQSSNWQKLQNSISEQPSNAPFPTIHTPIAPNTPSNSLNTNSYGVLEPLQPPVNFMPAQPAQQTISPPKRTSSRFNSQIKSPVGKSPSKSPKNAKANSQIVTPPPPPVPKQRNRSNRNNNSGGRGRGRGRGRQTTVALPHQYDCGIGEFKSIHNNLRGTVYDLDFDEDFGNNGESLNLKSLRDRRRSFDSRGLINSTHSTPERKDLQRVLPVLPGPVDMRTYSFDAQHSTDPYSNSALLGAFDTGTADQTLHDIDEEDEKEFQSALKATQVTVCSVTTTATMSVVTTAPSTRPTSPPKVPTPDVVMSAEGQVSISSEEVSIDSDTINTMQQTVTAKASLSDSGNQLKLKIKGPLAYPDNYTISSFNSTTVTTVSASSVTQVQTTNATSMAGHRRMRKKELLEKYWYSDMNNEDSVGLPPVDNQKLAEANGTAEKRVSIPKAVDSMILLPSKDDESPPNKRKKMEGKQGGDSGKRRTSICSVESADNNKMSAVGRRSGRTRNKDSGGSEGDLSESVTDKPVEGVLKMTIRNNSVEKRIVSCPPKKRHAAVNIADYPSTSLEQYKNNCMKYRQEVMADFEESDHKVKKVKEKKSKKHKKEKKEKKKKIEILDSSGGGLKLCLRIGKPAEAATEEAPPSTAPLKLKFSRKTSGGGYALDKSAEGGKLGGQEGKDCDEAR